MKKEDPLIRYRSIPEIHKAFGMPKPKHPLVSLTHFDRDKPINPDRLPGYDVLDFYKITFISDSSGRLKYGQDYYDFNDGGMLFLAPNQLVGATDSSGDAECCTRIFCTATRWQKK